MGNLRGASRSALTAAVNSLKLNITEIASVEEATAAIEKQPWCAVLIDTTLSGASRFCAEARSHRSLFGIPFIALSPRLTDLAFLNALRWGADDVVALGATEALSVRLATLLGSPTLDAAPARGEAVVADPDRRRGNGLGRAVHTAGYSVRYAIDTTSARFYTTKSEVELFILNAELTEPRPFIQDAQQNGCTARWVVLAKASQTDDLQKELASLKGVVVMSSGGPPENVLFAVNLLYPSEASRRGEIRALFGTVVFFRAVGDYRDECGFSYTASPQGLYVRTLAPPPSDKVWVELIPPDGERRVRLVGKVAWSRAYGRQAGEAAPPGFGVRIVDGLGEDLALWSDCLKGLEFRAPATLVPEARFSLPAAARPLVDPAPPASLPAVSVRQALPSVSIAPMLSAAQPVSLRTPSLTDEGETTRLSIAPSVPQPPLSTSMDRLSAAAKARISTRPSLRLSIPSPNSLRRDPLSKTGRLSAPPVEEKAVESVESMPEPAPAPKRVGQGRTVMGLGILQRDGSLTVRTDGDGRLSELPPAPAGVVTSAAPTGAAPSDPPQTDPPNGTRADPLRLSPVTGRTLSYGSEPPTDLFQAAADALTQVQEDISERPTLSDRMSLERAEQLAQSLTPAAPQAFDSLPPDALESDAPSAPVAPMRQRAPSFPAMEETPAASALAETDRKWVGLEVIPAEQRLSDVPPPPVGQALPVAPGGRSDLGATLPGMVVDTVALGKSSAEDNAPADVDTPAPNAAIDDAAVATVPRRHSSPLYELPSLQARGVPSQIPGVPPKRRTVLPVLFAAAVAAVVIGLMMRSKPPAATAAAPNPATVTPKPSPAVVAAPANVSPNPSASPGLASPVATSAATSGTPAAVVTATAEPVAAPAPTPTVQAPAAPEVVEAAAPEPPKPSTPTAETAGVAPVAPAAPAPPDTEPPRDPNTLSTKNAWLYVHSAVDAHVFVHGIDAGTTNAWLETGCGTRFVRLGRAPGDWLSPGVPTIIRCRSANTIEVSVP